MNLELWLIRHGQTSWNAEGRIQGQMDSDLSELGLKQAAKLAERLKGETFDHVYSSDSKRAKQTGEIALPNADFVLDERLREIGFGRVEGKTHAELSEEESAWFEHFRQDPYNHRIPEGESWQEHIARLADWMTGLPKEGRAIAFTHGGSVRAVIFSILGYPKRYEWNLSFHNTGITKLRLEAQTKMILSINDTAHLEGPT